MCVCVIQPTFFYGSLLAVFGIEIVADWLGRSWAKVARAEYILLWLTFLAICQGERNVPHYALRVQLARLILEMSGWALLWPLAAAAFPLVSMRTPSDAKPWTWCSASLAEVLCSMQFQSSDSSLCSGPGAGYRSGRGAGHHVVRLQLRAGPHHQLRRRAQPQWRRTLSSPGANPDVTRFGLN